MQRREDIERVCKRYGVSRLRIFGSALTERFDPEQSDIDILVDFDADAERTFQAFFALQEELETVLGHDVDLVEARNIRNPYIARSVFDTALDVYAA
ncbi:nucleotidyltransferase family protein [Gulosibacter sp. 10]|uniref:nucleotidyltransferase family protein n=1 Tax=Gulosibacter sp. 10 TaxID=1255570 RepID=UPI000B354DBF|nr:nucleotidyltransferase domain-containing protein [Gulosibacter sp. 10]